MQPSASAAASDVTRIPGRALALFALVAFGLAGLTRLLVLPLSVVDWDESVYLLISRDILGGVFPYQGGFDHKPVGLYYTFALAQLLFGKGILAIRLLAIAAVGLTAFLVAVFLRRSTAADTPTAAAAAALYALLSTLNGGLATNTEILLNVYAVAALILLNGSMMCRYAPRPAALAGIVLALMLHTNYIAAIPIAGLAAAYAVAVWRIHGARRGAGLWLRNGLVAVGGACAATAVLLLPIALWSDIGDYLGRQAAYLGLYRKDTAIDEYARSLFKALVNYAPLLALAASALFLTIFSQAFRRGASPRDGAVAGQSFIYLAAALGAAAVSGRLFPHYFILALPSLCIVAGQFLSRVPAAGALRPACTVWLLLASAAFLAIERQDFRPGWDGARKWLAGQPPDVPAEIARDLRGRLKPEDIVYVYDYEPILYQLLDRPLPLQYFFPRHHLMARFGLDRAAEMERVMARAPRFVIAGRDPHAGDYDIASERLSRALDGRYALLQGIPHPGRGIVRIYERRTGLAGEGAGR